MIPLRCSERANYSLDRHRISCFDINHGEDMHSLRKYSGFLLVMLSALATASCDAVLGPPGSGEDIPFPSRPSAFGRAYEHLLEGRPDQTAMRLRGGYYVWKEGDRWHIRVSRVEGPPTMYGPGPVFTGTVFVENGFISGIDTGQATERAFRCSRSSS